MVVTNPDVQSPVHQAQLLEASEWIPFFLLALGAELVLGEPRWELINEGF